MADRIKGITIQIGGDTTGLNKALSSTNKEINSTKSQLKDVERLLKLDPTNTELLAQKEKLLSKAVEETKTKLDTLKEAEKQAQEQFAKGEISEQQYMSLEREIQATEQSLKELEKQANKSNATLEKIGATADKVASGAEKVANSTKRLSVAAAGGVAALGGLAVKAAKSADDLNTLAKQSGFSTDEIQKWSYAADLVDVSVDDIVGAAKKLKKNMTGASATWEKLGISTRGANGELRDSTEVFYEAIEALSKIDNETERDVVAMELFGKSADNLAGIVDDGGAALKELGEEAEKAGIILSKDTLDSANKFNDSMDRLKAETQGQFMEIGAEIADELLPVLEHLGDVIGKVVGWFASLDSSQQKTIMIVLSMVAAISPLASIIGKLSTGISFLATTVLPALGTAFTFIASNPIVLLIGAIVGLVALIVAKGDEIITIIQSIDEFFQSIFLVDFSESFGFLGDLINSFLANVENVWDSIKTILTGIISFVKGVFTGDWKKAWNGVKEIFSGVFKGLVAIAKAPINSIIGILNGVISGLNTLIGGLNKLSFDVPDWVPFMGGKKFGLNIPTIGKVPYLAKGGTITDGTAIVGEAGAEVLTVSNGRATVQPLSGSAPSSNGLSDILGRLDAMMPILEAGTKMYIDSKTLVGATAPAMNRELGKMAIREANR